MLLFKRCLIWIESRVLLLMYWPVVLAFQCLPCGQAVPWVLLVLAHLAPQVNPAHLVHPLHPTSREKFRNHFYVFKSQILFRSVNYVYFMVWPKHWMRIFNPMAILMANAHKYYMPNDRLIECITSMMYLCGIRKSHPRVEYFCQGQSLPSLW